MNTIYEILYESFAKNDFGAFKSILLEIYNMNARSIVFHELEPLIHYHFDFLESYKEQNKIIDLLKPYIKDF